MAIVLTNHKSANATAAGAVTTAAVDMTGSTLLVVVATAKFVTGDSFTITDSTGANTWTPGTSLFSGSNTGNNIQLFYSFGPTVTGSQTFTLTTVTGTFPGIYVLGFSGTLTTASVFDAATTGTSPNPTTTVQPGSITPAGAGEVFVTGAANNDGAVTISIDSSFVITDSDGTASFELAGAAYLVVAGSGAQNPTWTFASNTGLGLNAVMAAFKPAAGGPIFMLGHT